jgi:hypothetical protein
VSKKKSAKKTRAASASRRTPASRSRSRVVKPKPKAKAKAGPTEPKIQLKPILVLVDRAIAGLQKLPPTEATDITIRHLQTCAMALGDICDPNTPGGCGPNMEFPPLEALATSRA